MYTLPNIIRVIKSRRMRQAGCVAYMGEMRNPYNILVGIPEGKRPLRRPRHRWEDIIRNDLRGTGWEDCGLDSCGLGSGPVLDSCERSNEPSGSMKEGKFLD
jgi:hypothetical protein